MSFWKWTKLRSFFRGPTVWALAIVSLCSSSAIANSSGLRTLEQVVSRADSLQQFLNDEQLLNEYFVAIRAYYGFSDLHLPRENFDVFISQLRDLANKSESFSRAIWSTERSFGVEHGFEAIEGFESYLVDGEKLGAFLFKYIEDASKKVKAQFPNFATDLPNKSVDSVLAQVSKEIEDFNHSVRNFSKRQRTAAQTEFYETLKRREDIEAAIHAFHLRRINTTKLLDRLGSVATAEVLDILTGESQRNDVEVPLVYRQLAGWFLPKPDQLEKEGVLKVTVQHWLLTPLKPGSYRFMPTPRALHAIFKGALLNECVGGGCQHIDNLTPERWATVALANVQFYFVEVNGRSSGWLQLIPIKRVKDKVTFLNFESGTMLFRQDVTTAARPFSREAVVSAWLREFANSVESRAGVVMSESYAINNSGSIPNIRDSLSFRLGPFVGHHTEFAHHDQEMVDFVAGNSPKSGPQGRDFISQYNPGMMIIDATAGDPGFFRELEVVDNNLIVDLATLRTVYENAGDNWRGRYLSQFMQYDYTDNRIAQLIREWWNNLDSEQKKKVFHHLSYDAQYGTLRPSRLILELAMRDEADIIQIFTGDRNRKVNAVEQTVTAFSDFFTERTYSSGFFANLITALGENSNVGAVMAIRNVMASKAVTAAEVIAAGEPLTQNPSRRYRERLDRLIVSQLNRFFELNPTIGEIAELIKLATTYQTTLEIQRRGTDFAKTATGFLRMISYNFANPPPDYKAAIDQLIREKIDVFLGLDPTASQVLELIRLTRSAPTVANLIERYIPKMQTLDDWNTVMWLANFINSEQRISVLRLHEQYESHFQMLRDRDWERWAYGRTARKSRLSECLKLVFKK